jgi:alpha-ketoglutarate-dependent taurine dioxygenase
MTTEATRPQLVAGKAAWKADELAHSTEWILEADAEAVSALDRAVEGGRPPASDGSSVVTALMNDVRRRLTEGRGFVVVKGLPSGDSKEEAAAAFMTLGSLLGTPLPQNRDGDLLDEVRDVGGATPRGAKTNRALVYHTDFATSIPDVFALFAIRQAKEGGESLMVSGYAVHDELLRTRPDALARLYRDWHFDRTGDVAPGQEPVLKAPVFSRSNERLKVFYNRARIHRGHRVAGESLQAEDVEALDAFDELLSSPEFTFTFALEPGDALFADNSVVLHNRTAFVDFDEPERKRLLYRLWLRW